MPCLLLAFALLSCGRGTRDPEESPARLQEGAPRTAAGPESAEPRDLYVDITGEAGIRFVHYNDASPRRYLPETMGSGVAIFDFDEDGRPDIYFVNGAPLSGDRTAAAGALYRNIDGLHFRDVTAPSRLSTSFPGMGAAVGDYDNDGHTDLFVTGVYSDHLFRNRGDGTFEEVTARAGLEGGGFGSSAAFVDYDRDGRLDLFVGRYVRWRPETDKACTLPPDRRIYCTPELYPGDSSRLYRNLGGGRFRDVTRAAGVYRNDGKALGVAILDHNRDGWPDIAVANDTVPNFLFVNNGRGGFVERGTEAAMAYSDSGATRGGMGIDTGDVDSDGRDDIVIGNFSKEMAALYRASEGERYADEATQSGIGMATLLALTFGTLMIDFDGDGSLDLVFANGHIEPEIALAQPGQSYAQPPLFLRNEGNRRFRLLAGTPGSVSSTPLVARGMASADLDGDGDLDLVITQNGRAPVLLRNESPPRSWIRLQFVGTRSNRSGFGATAMLAAEGRTWTRSLRSGRSYLSACEPVLTIGLGKVERINRLEIAWPSGSRQVVSDPAVNRLLRVVEP